MFQKIKEMIRVNQGREWRERDGIIYSSVTSDGTTGPQWLGQENFEAGDYANCILSSKDFVPTSGIIIEFAILNGAFYEDSHRITKHIRAEAEKRNWKKPNPELACLIGKKFTNEEIEDMGLKRVVAMDEPIKDSEGNFNLLYVTGYGKKRWLGAYHDRLDEVWCPDNGFAFEIARHFNLPQI